MFSELCSCCPTSIIESQNDVFREFYNEVEVGANETATVIDAKLSQTESPASPDPDHSENMDFSQQETSSSQQCDYDQNKPLQCGNSCAQELAHAVSSDMNLFRTACGNEQELEKPEAVWQNEVNQVGDETSRGIVQQTQKKSYYAVNLLSSNTGNGSERQLFYVGRSEPQTTSVYTPTSGIPVAVPVLQPSGIIPTNTSYLLQQPEVSYGNMSTSISSYPVLSTGQVSRDTLPSYISGGFAMSQQLNFTYQNYDANSNVIPYQLGPHRRPEEFLQHANAAAVPGHPSIFGTAQGSATLCTDTVPLQQSICGSSLTADALSAYSFFSQPQHRTTLPLHQQYLNTVNTTKPSALILGSEVMTTEVQHHPQQHENTRRGENQNLVVNGFQLPLFPGYSSDDQGKNLLKSQGGQSNCVEEAINSNSPPILEPTICPLQEVNEDEVQVCSSTLPHPSAHKRWSANAQDGAGQSFEPAINSIEDLAVFAAPRRLGMNLSKQACYTKKRSQTIDVLVRNSVKNFEMSVTGLTSKPSLLSPRSPLKVLNSDVINHEKPRPHSYLSIIKYPNMADVNFRRRPGAKAPSRPRHLCEQTRDIVARVLAFFREFAKRFAALGNDVKGTPFENPERMASQATGFTLPTVRRCGERMEAVPPCTASSAGAPTEEDICNLSWIFSEEPWYIAQRTKGRTSTTARRKTRKRAPSLSPSLSEIEKDPEESAEEQTIEADLDLLESDENEEGVPKRRRSERIRNQRRAKLLKRLKTINATAQIRSPARRNDIKLGAVLPNSEIPNFFVRLGDKFKEVVSKKKSACGDGTYSGFHKHGFRYLGIWLLSLMLSSPFQVRKRPLVVEFNAFFSFSGKEKTISTDGCATAGSIDLSKEEKKCHSFVKEGTSKGNAVAQMEEQPLPKRCPRTKRFHRSHSTESSHSSTGQNMRIKRSKSVTEDSGLNAVPGKLLDNCTEVRQLSNKPGNAFQGMTKRRDVHAEVNVASRGANVTSEIPKITL
ncbi:hypothetical protein Y032_0225g2751 [Ancylostoma ceylanicum]|uniref:Uncharacterized protein n=1 Tax=Ancylostoma ceylanicum TaxID=53326 RepID=A0A016SI16_9BILA|nr:hypothetical protein Y032_0225g2751 [Ancylostoma ceylanicum]